MDDATRSFAMTINGQAIRGEAVFTVVNPANERVIATAPDCTRQQLDLAVEAATAAFPAWAGTSLAERAVALEHLAAAILEFSGELATLLTAEQGKPIASAQAEIAGAAQILRNWSQFDLPVEVVEAGPDRRVEVHREPIGVVAAIAPWNFPIGLACTKFATALVAGNTVVLKPSPFTPLATLLIGEIGATILPPGVLNVISGEDRLGPWLTSHPGVAKVSFTGSTATGKRVMESAAATLKRVTLELGGNDAAIVLPDVDPAQVAAKLFDAGCRNAGQVCIAAKRLYIHEDIYDAVMTQLKTLASNVVVGDGSNQATQMGPLNNRPQFERVQGLIAACIQSGLSVFPEHPILERAGYFVRPTIIDNPPEDHRIVQEEQFAPVLPLLKFRDVDEVVDRANATHFGLGASIWSGDLKAAHALAARLDCGMVWINELPGLHPRAPFAGHRESGIGAENGLDGLLAFTNPKTIISRPAMTAA